MLMKPQISETVVPDTPEVARRRYENPNVGIEILYTLFNIPLNDSDCYSLIVNMIESGVCTESTVLFDLTRKFEAGRAILDLFADNGVTPVTAHDVIGDML